MNHDASEKHYRVLGLEPHAPMPDVKAAYRDLAKVWHPDRFTHDPRLQQKAQEKLKEINEAYKELTSPDLQRRSQRAAPRRPARTQTRAQREPHTQPPPPPSDNRENDLQRRRRTPRPVAVVLGAFAVAVIAATVAFPYLSNNDSADAEHSNAPTLTQSPNEIRGDTGDAVQTPAARAEKASAATIKNQPRAAGEPATETSGDMTRPAAPEPPALPTVKVTIDPTTYMLASASCPFKVSMTYPSGREPRALCNDKHAAVDDEPTTTREETRQDKSRLKSLAGRVASPTKWFSSKKKKNQPSGQPKESAP